MKYYFKVKYGFGASEFVSLEDQDVEKAIYAQIKKIPAKLGDSYINGSNIISISPHYHKYTGWIENYEPKELEDWQQIERDCPKDFDRVLRGYQEKVFNLIETNNLKEIGTNKLQLSE